MLSVCLLEMAILVLEGLACALEVTWGTEPYMSKRGGGDAM